MLSDLKTTKSSSMMKGLYVTEMTACFRLSQKKGPKLLLRALPFNDRLSRNESISVPENHTPAIRTKAEETSSTKIQESKFNPFTLKSFRVSSPNRKYQEFGGAAFFSRGGSILISGKYKAVTVQYKCHYYLGTVTPLLFLILAILRLRISCAFTFEVCIRQII